MSKAKLGRYLEWHGNRIRVVVRVAPALIAKVGRTKLREVLTTRDPIEAEREKVDVVRRLKAELKGEKVAVIQSPLTDEALRWRDAADQAAASQDDAEIETVRTALSDRVDNVRAQHGWETAQTFASVASGIATPLTSLLSRWFAEMKFSVGYEEDIRRAVRRLEEWCQTASVSTTVEAIQKAVAGRFVHDRYIAREVDPTTANKDIGCLHSYWEWMQNRHNVAINPWRKQRIRKSRQREAGLSRDKRPFTDEEASKLLGCIRIPLDWEFSMISALSGLRINEIAALRVKDCQSEKIAVTKSKTPSGVRTIPLHPLLQPLIKNRSGNKAPTDYLFDELPEQRANSKRDRSAPVSQSFTRERRRLGVEEKATDKQRQSNVDFHSWRRWFIRNAVNALTKAEPGYTPWTIASVVGHKVEDGSIEGVSLPLGMTMGRYPGAASWAAMAACVNAVTLPTKAPRERKDLTEPSELRKSEKDAGHPDAGRRLRSEDHRTSQKRRAPKPKMKAAARQG